MLEFESKRKFKKRLYSKFTLVVLLIIFALVLNGTFKIFQKHRIISQDLSSTIETLEEREAKKGKLESEIERIESPVGREEILRENYSLARPNEKAVYVLKEEYDEIEEIEKEGLLGKTFSLIKDLFN